MKDFVHQQLLTAPEMYNTLYYKGEVSKQEHFSNLSLWEVNRLDHHYPTLCTITLQKWIRYFGFSNNLRKKYRYLPSSVHSDFYFLTLNLGFFP